MSRYVIGLSSRAALQPALSGGKGAGLAWLKRQNVNVPPGFVVTTTAFGDFLSDGSAELGRDWRQLSAADAEMLCRALETVHYPPRIAEAIIRAFRRLGGPVAVRSSLVGEDASQASFAGQFRTLLHVDDEESVLAAVRACWASCFECGAAAYLARQEASGAHDHSGKGPAMAVVVQRMVAANAAGVAFSADPISGEFCTIIEAVRGLGDALVSGRADADRYLIDAHGVLAESAAILPEAPVLREAEILRLVEIVRDLHSRAGGPQDVEWAFDGAEFHILQCRPITSLTGQHVYSNRLTADMAPGLIKPIVYSTNTYAIARQVFGKLFTELIGPNDYDFTRLTPLICSRVYADMTLMGELLVRIGLPPNFMEMMLRSERAERERTMRMDLRTLLAMGRMARLAVRHGRLPRQQAALLTRWRVTLDAYRGRDWSQTPLVELLAELDSLITFRNSTYWLFFVTVMGLAVRNSLLRHWVERRAGDVPFNDLIRGLTGLRSLEPMHAVGKLAELARQLPPELRQDLSLIGSAERRVRLGVTPAGQALLAGVDAFLGRFGFLSSNGSDFTAITWSENPGPIWQAIARTADCPPAALPEVAAAAREEARQHARARFTPVALVVFDRLLASVTAAIDLRESVSLMMSEYSYEIRRLFLAVAERFVTRGDLSEREDLFYLTYDEMVALADKCLPANAARAHIAERRAEIEADAQITPPGVISGNPSVARRAASPAPSHATCLTGIAGSSGTAQGRARVVDDPAAAPAVLGRDDILVIPYSDVGWTPLFASIGGIVAETGGQLSHAAIVAREYGLPAVVGVKSATRLISEGQPVSIDGSRGRVYLEMQPPGNGGDAWTQ